MELEDVLLAVLAVMFAAVAYRVYWIALEELGFYRFIREHGFRRSPIASTMWLARVLEHAAALSVEGEWDGLAVTVNRHRRRVRGMTIVVTAEAELVPASAGNVTIGPWTKPEPPALVRTGFSASGRELRLHIADPLDPAPYVDAAVTYARTLAKQPVEFPS